MSFSVRRRRRPVFWRCTASAAGELCRRIKAAREGPPRARLTRALDGMASPAIRAPGAINDNSKKRAGC
jgi:hypothetical protein